VKVSNAGEGGGGGSNYNRNSGSGNEIPAHIKHKMDDLAKSRRE